MKRFEIYEARDGWRWRIRAANGRVVADSGEAYTTRHGVKRAVRWMQDANLGHVFVTEVKP